MANMRIGGNLEEVGTISGGQLVISGATGDTTTQTIQANIGAVATPGITFVGDTDTGLYRSAANTLAVTAGGTAAGTFTSTGYGNADGVVWIPATSIPAICFTTGTWTLTRLAAGDYAWVHTDGDETSTIEIPLTAGMLRRTTASAGIQILGLRYVWFAGTANMDAHTYDILDAVYADQVAVSVGTSYGGTLTGTLATVKQTTPQVATITTGTDTFLSDLQGLLLQVTANNAATTVYRTYGVFLDCAYKL